MPPGRIHPLGGQGASAATLLWEVTKRAGADGGTWTRRARAQELRQALSLALMLGVTAQLDARCLVEEPVD